MFASELYLCPIALELLYYALVLLEGSVQHFDFYAVHFLVPHICVHHHIICAHRLLESTSVLDCH